MQFEKNHLTSRSTFVETLSIKIIVTLYMCRNINFFLAVMWSYPSIAIGHRFIYEDLANYRQLKHSAFDCKPFKRSLLLQLPESTPWMATQDLFSRLRTFPMGCHTLEHSQYILLRTSTSLTELQMVIVMKLASTGLFGH